MDSRGRVIGVNTAIVAMAQGLGFAVPAKIARWVVGELIAHGRVRRLSLGIVATAVPLPRRLAREHDLLSDQAVEVVEVAAKGAAAAAGVRPGDLIVAVGGRIITGVDDLHQILASWPTSNQLTLTVLRSNRLLDVPVEARTSE